MVMTPLKLTELEPQFLRRDDDTHWTHVGPEEANGIVFICPKCYTNNNKQRPGVHSIICWDLSVPLTTTPGPGRWNLVGTSYEDLSLVGGSSSSIWLQGKGCGWHGFIENGMVRDA